MHPNPDSPPSTQLVTQVHPAPLAGNRVWIPHRRARWRAFLPVVLLVIGVGAGWWFGRGVSSKERGTTSSVSESSLTGRPSANVPTLSTDAVERDRQIEEQTIRAKQAEQMALAKRNLEQILAEGQKVLVLADAFDSEVKAWSSEIETLLTSDRGRCLAGKESAIQGFRAIYDADRPTRVEGASARQRVDTLLQPVRDALSNGATTYTPSSEWISSFQKETDTLRRLIGRYREPRLQIEALVTDAQREGTGSPMTLQEAIADLDARNAKEQARLVAEARAKAQHDADVQIAAAEGDKVRQEAAQKLAQMEADKEAQRVDAETKEQQTRDETEHQRKLKLAQGTDVKRLMIPFTTEGYWQPGAEDGEITTKGPVSLSRLRATGALEPTSKGLQTLLLLGGKSRSWQPPEKQRPRWGFEPYLDKLSASQMDELKKAQEYLRDLGDAMVELKMLAP